MKAATGMLGNIYGAMDALDQLTDFPSHITYPKRMEKREERKENAGKLRRRKDTLDKMKIAKNIHEKLNSKRKTKKGISTNVSYIY